MKQLRLLLLPFSVLYYLIYNVRYFLYKVNFFKTHAYKIPIVKIGNIITGGTGKTPVTKFIADYFLTTGVRVAIISRGYKRESKGLVNVYSKGKLNLNLKEAGDELFMLAKQFDNSEHKFAITILASEDRNIAIKYICENNLADIILLDDAFQNFSVNEDLNIVIITQPRSILDKLFLPAGNLRESKWGLRRADLIIFNEKFSKDKQNSHDVILNYKMTRLVNVYGNELNSDEVKLVCGIGDPDSFLISLNDSNLKINRRYIFSDHYNYSEVDIKKIFSDSDLPIVTTEKDFYKLILFAEDEIKPKIFYAELELNFRENYSILKSKLDNLIENIK